MKFDTPNATVLLVLDEGPRSVSSNREADSDYEAVELMIGSFAEFIASDDAAYTVTGTVHCRRTTKMIGIAGNFTEKAEVKMQWGLKFQAHHYRSEFRGLESLEVLKGDLLEYVKQYRDAEDETKSESIDLNDPLTRALNCSTCGHETAVPPGYDPETGYSYAEVTAACEKCGDVDELEGTTPFGILRLSKGGNFFNAPIVKVDSLEEAKDLLRDDNLVHTEAMLFLQDRTIYWYRMPSSRKWKMMNLLPKED